MSDIDLGRFAKYKNTKRTKSWRPTPNQIINKKKFPSRITRQTNRMDNNNIISRLKKLSVWKNHNCINCKDCKKCHSCLINNNKSINCNSNTTYSIKSNTNESMLEDTIESSTYNTANDTAEDTFDRSSTYETAEDTFDRSSTYERTYEDSNYDKNYIDIDWKLQIYNNKFVYGINPAINKNDSERISYFLSQYTGPSINLGDITLTTNNSAIFYAQINSSGTITSAFNLWSYNGIRDDYQFGQLKFTNENELIIISTFVGEITFTGINNEETTISDNNGNIFIAKLLADGTPIWIRQITAKSINDIYFDLDPNDNIYICGTFSGTLQINDPNSTTITSNLESNMFVGKLSEDGITQWLKTATGTGYNTGEGVSYSSVDETIVIIGTFNGQFIINGDILVNENDICNMWVAKLNLDGDVLNLVAPLNPTPDEPNEEYMDGGQVVVDSNGDVFIAGDMFGNFVFGNIEIDVSKPSVFVTKLDENLNWLWVQIEQVDIPVNNSFQPKLTVSDSCVYLANYGIGTVRYIQINGYNDSSDDSSDDGYVKFKCEGSGSLDHIISKLSKEGKWLASTKLCGTVENFSIDIISNNTNVYVAGTHCVNTDRTDAYLVNINVD